MTERTKKLTAVQKILWQVLVLNLLVAFLKIAVGLFSGILSMVADGFHSLVDGSSNVIGLVAMRVASAPPDEEHPYGHRKAETLATMVIGLMLLLAAYEILKSTIDRLAGGAVPDVPLLSFGVMIFTIIVNLGVTVYEARQGKALKSDILLADSQHTRSDIWVSLSVIVGLVGVRFGLTWLDAAVGLVIAGIIGHAAYGILSDGANVLLDAASLPADDIERLALALPEVRSVERIRSRGVADDTYVDLHVRVAPDTPTDYAHSIAHAVQHQIKTAYPQAADVVVHIEPDQSARAEHPNVARQLKAIAHSLGGSAHEIWVHSIKDRYFVELHFEVQSSLSLRQAHDLATELEDRGKQALSQVDTITTHIEPMGETVPVARQPHFFAEKPLLDKAKTITDEICGEKSAHNMRLWEENDGWTLSMHCKLDGDLSIVAAHALSRQAEDALRREIPALQRAVIHMEPL